MNKPTIALALLLGLSSCAELMQVAETYGSTVTSKPLTELDVINGLKQALTVGTDTAVTKLAKTNGYYGNALYKILLPPEADVIVRNVSKIPGGQKLVDNVVLSINRAAEDAVKEAAPVFVGAIKQMTVQDAWGILRGQENAATEYLKKTTSAQLFDLYNPKIQTSLDKPLLAGISANQSWKTLTDQWNTVAQSAVGKLAGFTPVSTDLDNYLTEKALNGLYLQIAAQEKQIRQDPVARVTDLLKRVFGS
ncbi:MAG: DUF4197 domain-containing protein [Breznakibacter sp.]